ncbi:MAG: hypothetical protein KBA15_05530 [Spirochaetes bacterium]|jgi:hypothetical protein|nr:hypothetical protein [Spirochaetota bacterium]
MKQAIIAFAVVLWASVLLADEIHLNDGQVIRGKVLKVTERTIEYDPEGDEPFDVFPRGQIQKIVYDSGKTVFLNEGGEAVDRPIESRREGETSPPEKPGAHRHDGFFLRAQLGFGSGATVIEDYQGDDLETSGAATTFNLQIGYAIFDNFILFLENGASVMPESKLKHPSAISEAQKENDVAISTFGLGFSWYWMPYNIYIAPVLSLSVTEYDGAMIKGDSRGGSGLSLSIGKEWWVSANWGLGVALFIFGGGDTVKDQNGIKYDMSSSVFGIMFTATYN